MRIAIYSDNFYPEISGISDSICITAQVLAEQGHHILCVAPYYSNRNYNGRPHHIPFFEHPRLKIVRIPSLPVYTSPTGQSRMSIPILTSLSKVRDFAPDIIHSHSPFGTGIEALLTSRILHVPLIGTNHTPIELYVPRPFKYVLRRLYVWYYNRCIFISTPYTGLLNDMKHIGLKSQSGHVPNPVSLETPTTQYTPEHAYKKPYILYTGRLAQEKKVDVTITAFAKVRERIPDLQFYIAGIGNAKEKLINLSKTLGVFDSVHFLDFIEHEKLAELYNGADLFIIMSDVEIQSLSLLQAYASGVPAIVANRGGLPSSTPKECGIIVEPTRIDDVVHAMDTILKNNALREQLSIGAKTFAQQFSAPLITETWSDVYTRFAKSNENPSTQ